MSLGSLGRLGIEIYADTAQFTGDLGKIERAAASMGASVTGSLGGVIKGLGALGIGLAAVDFISKTRDALEHADALGKLAQKTGLAVDELSRMAYAAKLADVSNETLAKGIKGLSDKMVEANDANSESARLFKSIGVDIKGGISPAIEKLADQFAALPDGATKTALAVKIFGKAGQEMIPFLNGGADGIRRLKEEATALGVTIDKDTAAAAERFNDNMRAMKTGAEALGNTLASKTAAALADVTDAMKEAYKESGLLLAVWVGLGGAAAKIFTDDSLTEAQKVTKRMGELREELTGVRQRLLDSQDVMGPWGDKLRESLIAAAAKGTLELKQLNDQLIAIKRAQLDANAAEEQKRANQKAEEKRIRDQLSLEEQRKKAAAEVKAWNEKLRQEDLKGWVAYAEEQIKSYEAELADEAKLTEDYYREKDRMQQLDAKGWIAKIESDTKEYEDELRAMAKLAEDFYREQDRVRDIDTKQQIRAWDEFGESAGRFFADLVMNGRSAFDRLKQSLKSFAAEILALFAKKYIMQMIAGVTGSTALDAAASAVGAGTAAGGIGSAIFGSAAAGTGIAGAASNFAMGFSAPGVAAPGFFAEAGAALAAMGPVGWAILAAAAVAAVVNLTRDKENPRVKLGFGSNAQGYVSQGLFGPEGFKYIETNDAGNQALRDFMKSLKPLDDRIAKFLTPGQIAGIGATLNAQGQREFSFAPGDNTASAQITLEYLKQKYSVVFKDLDATFAEFVKNFTGSTEDLSKAILGEVNVLDMLDPSTMADFLKGIPDLTVEGLRKVQQAGEALSDTFGRVVNEFLTAQNNLNSAIAARNPQFARDLVLGQRNTLGAQFAASIGQQYDGNLAAQMALNPQSFTGLNTLQMGMLAQWLGLQTQLEQLDQQLAQNANAANNVATSFNNAATAADNYASQLADSRASLAQFLHGSLLSASSPLDPMEKYAEARRQLDAQLALANSGDMNAISGLGGFLQAFWDASHMVNGSSGQYNADYFQYYNTAAALTGGQAGPLTGDQFAAGNAQTVAAIQSVSDNSAANTSATLALIQLIASGTSTNDPEAVALLQEIRQALLRGNGVTL